MDGEGGKSLLLEEGGTLMSPAAGSSSSTALLSRWWVLATYTLMAALQGLTWTVPGTLQATFTAVYGMDGDTVQLLLNYGPIWYIPFSLPFMLWLDRKGCRGSTLAGIALVVTSNVMRCFANDSTLPSIVIVHISFILNAIAGPVAMAVPSKLAEDWFPPDERTTATAIAALGNQSGALILYLIVPLLCPDTTASDQLRLNILLAALSIANALMAAYYFPSHPPLPPSASAAVTKQAESSVTLVSVLKAWAAMGRNGTYMVILVAYSLILGLGNAVGALLPANLSALGADQATSGWVGFAGNLGSMILGIALAGLADRLKKRSRAALKAFLVLTTVAAGCTYMLVAVMLSGALPAASWPAHGGLIAVAACFTGASVFTGAAIPLMFDVAAEQTYPQPEATMLMGLTTAMNAVTLVVLLAPSASFFSWANWGTAGVTLASALALQLVLPTTAPRYEYDQARGERGKGEGRGLSEEGEGEQDGLLPVMGEGPAP